MSESSRFLEAVFEFKQDDHYICIWTLRDKASRWFLDIEEAAQYVDTLAATDVYCGVSLTDQIPEKRASEKDVIAVAGFVADVDYGPSENNKVRPPTAEAALSIIQAMPVQPSIIVHSGHGFHAWWLFKEPWRFDSEKERVEAK